MHYSFAQHPEGLLAQDWILMNLISHLLRARNALSGINESLWVSFGRALLAERAADTQRAQLSAGSMDPFTVNEVERIMIRNLSSVSTTFYYHRRQNGRTAFKLFALLTERGAYLGNNFNRYALIPLHIMAIIYELNARGNAY